MSEDYEFEDDEPIVQTPKNAPKNTSKKTVKTSDFDAFADQKVDTDAAPASDFSTKATVMPGSLTAEGLNNFNAQKAATASDFSTKDTVMPGSMSAKDFDAFADVNVGAADDPDAESPNDEDIRPGQGKDLWTCPHCGSKNKPNRDSCRKCGKTADEEVVVPLFSRPPVKFGAIAAALLIIFLVYSAVTAIDVSLQQAGADVMDRNYHHDGQMIAGSGRVLSVTGDDVQTKLILVFGGDKTVVKKFKKIRYSTKTMVATLGKMKSINFIVLHIANDTGSDSAYKAQKGDYLAFSGLYDSAVATESAAQSDPENHIFSVSASNMEWNK